MPSKTELCSSFQISGSKFSITGKSFFAMQSFDRFSLRKQAPQEPALPAYVFGLPTPVF
jgi:hypothetical protein